MLKQSTANSNPRKTTKRSIVVKEGKYNLFLDDFRNLSDAHAYLPIPEYCTEEWVIVRNYDEFVKYISENGIPDIISFDHDLADVHYEHVPEINYDKYQEKTGYHCAKWLIEYCLDNNLNIPRKIIIHSMNRMGAQNIKSLFDTYNKLYPNGTN